ncbi:hypothetical protein V6Z11_A08G168700 [Gossypium hirsutum]
MTTFGDPFLLFCLLQRGVRRFKPRNPIFDFDFSEGDEVSDGSYAKVRVRGCALALGVRRTKGGRGVRGLRAGRTALKVRRGC